MATKTLKEITVKLLGCETGNLFASDTRTDPNATYALDDFKDEKYMVLKDGEDEGSEYYVPFHAVDHISVYTDDATVPDRPDPYGCEGSDKGEVWFTSTDKEGYIQFDENGEKRENGATTSKSYQEWLDLFKNPTQYELTLKTSCGEWQMQYEAKEDGGQFYPPEETGAFVPATLIGNSIEVSGEVEGECLPVRILVIKK